MTQIELSASLAGAATYQTKTWHLATEREVCQRALELIESGNVVELRVNGGFVPAESFTARLALIEARRRAVAVELLVLGRESSPGWKRLYAEDPEGYWTSMLHESERDYFLASADRLIAAYEQASA